MSTVGTPHLVSGGSRDWSELVANPYRVWRERYPGRRAFGYLCTYAPLEVLHAAGFVPVRLMQSSGPVALADAHLPSFSCALARTVTERMLTGELDFLEGVLFVHTCDTMQCAADIWRMAGPHFKVVNFSLPTVLSAAGARSYLLGELQHLQATLQNLFGPAIAQEALWASIAAYDEQRRLLTRLYERRDQFRAEELWPLTQAAMVMPVEEHNALLQTVLQSGGESWPLARSGPGIVLTGAILDDITIPRLIEELGAQVVGDDLCTGSRFFEELVAKPVDDPGQHERGDPLAALADRYLRRPPCPAKHDAAHPRAERLLALVQESGAQGVVFVLTKFCDPHAFDYVALTSALAAAGVPHLLLETDITVPVGQLRTRLQAFLEMLGQEHERTGAHELREG